MEVTIFMADGLEECEALLVVDLLRRADIPIQTVAVHSPDWAGQDEDKKRITSAHHIEITCDESIDDYELGQEKALVIPGGLPGVDYLKANAKLRAILERFNKESVEKEAGHLAAICAGPTLLADLGLLDGKAATVFPSKKSELGDAVDYVDEGVVTAPGLITGKSLGHAIPFALAIITALRDKACADRVAEEIYFTPAQA